MLRLDGAGLAVPDVVAVARDREPVRLAPGVLERVARSRAFAAEVAARRHVYGRSTGVGANRAQVPPDPEAQARSLLRSHATSAGPLRSAERVRGMLVVRLNQLAADGNGIAPEILGALIDLLEGDVLPPVREAGSLGTGDLAALATTALLLAGESPGLPPGRAVGFGAGDALTFLSSNAGVLADASLAIADLDRLARAVPVVAALGFAAVRGNPEAFAPGVAAVTPFPGAERVCRWMRGLIDTEAAPARIQDPFGLRTLPQVHGPLLDRLDQAEAVVTALINAPAENPLLSATHGVAHHGGFHAAYLGQALDALRLALAQSAQLSLSRITMLADPAYTGLEPFLGDGTVAASGTMVVEYVAASALAELRGLAAPSGLESVTLSRGVEDDASFAAQAARRALDAVDSYRSLLSAELLTAHRAVLMQGATPTPLAEALDLLDAEPGGSSRDWTDRDLTADLAAAGATLERLAHDRDPG